MRDGTELLGLLAEPDRLRVVAALALGARTPAAVAAAAGVALPDVARALRRLEAGGLVGHSADGLELHAELFKEAARAAARRSEPADVGTADRATAAVLRAFLRDGRLVSIPAMHSKRRVVLDHIVRVFEPGVRYPEREVDALLRAFHADYAALRRYLVDEGFLSRDRGVYWRSGGTVEVDPPA